MDADRWRLIERLYHDAAGLTPVRRSSYLDESCGTDHALRREVESLLAHEEHAEPFLEEPAVQVAAPDLAADSPELTVGQSIDRYKILGLAGAGGMGTVYTAHDTRLGRTVALKFLADELTGDEEALERFGREARALSALNHPNICTIYDTGEAEGRIFMAMEHAVGRRLDQLIGDKGVALPEGLKYAVQIADALAKAHAAGIIHRDLKPGNIMVGEDGRVKLLDFGLAKLIAAKRRDGSAGSVRAGERARTKEGTIVGTAAYMSPEQAVGKMVDARSDIFSFGAVLYEMITGRRAFPGANDIATLSAVLNSDPVPFTQVSPGAPGELGRIVARCLRKDPERRFQNAADLKVALQEVIDDLDSGGLTAAGPVSRKTAAVTLAAIALVVIAAAVLIRLLGGTAQKQSSSLVITRLTADSGLTASPAISPDGKLVAYASTRSGEDNLDIWVQQIAGGPSNRLTSNPADDTLPDFSPDSSKIAFVSGRDGGGIHIVSTLGGGERLVVKTGPWASRPRFSPDGNWIAYSVGSGKGEAGIYIVRSTGGQPKELKLSVPWAAFPIWSPDGRHLLFVGSEDPHGFGGFDWWVAGTEGGEAANCGAASIFDRSGMKPPAVSFITSPSSWKGDRIVFASRVGDSANLWQAAISPGTWRIRDAPERLTVGAEQEIDPSLAEDGRLVFATTEERLSLWTLAIDANLGKARGGPRPLTQSGANSARPSLSVDGKTLVFESDRSGNVDVWMREMESGSERALTATPWDETHPAISPDGTKVFYASVDRSTPVIHVFNLKEGIAERLCEDCGMPMVWSADGRRILFYYRGLPTRYGSIDVVTRQRMDVIRHPKYNLHMARCFPEGDWLTFHVPILEKESSSPIFIAPMMNGAAPGESEWIRVTDGAGIEATPWPSPSGAILYFLSRRDGFQCIWAQHLDPATKRPKGPAFDIAHFHGARHTIREAGFGPGIAADKLVFTMSSRTGNLWMSKLEPRR